MSNMQHAYEVEGDSLIELNQSQEKSIALSLITRLQPNALGKLEALLLSNA